MWYYAIHQIIPSWKKSQIPTCDYNTMWKMSLSPSEYECCLLWRSKALIGIYFPRPACKQPGQTWRRCKCPRASGAGRPTFTSPANPGSGAMTGDAPDLERLFFLFPFLAFRSELLLRILSLLLRINNETANYYAVLCVFLLASAFFAICLSDPQALCAREWLQGGAPPALQRSHSGSSTRIFS